MRRPGQGRVDRAQGAGTDDAGPAWALPLKSHCRSPSWQGSRQEGRARHSGLGSGLRPPPHSHPSGGQKPSDLPGGSASLAWGTHRPGPGNCAFSFVGRLSAILSPARTPAEGGFAGDLSTGWQTDALSAGPAAQAWPRSQQGAADDPLEVA